MKLQDEIYEIEALGPGLSATVALKRDSVVFKAHFPGEPVVPGVCLIQMAGELLAPLIGRGLKLKGVANAKFLAVVNPDVTPALTFTFSRLTEPDAEGMMKATATVADAATVYSRISLVYQTA